jgi:hypothetical protein
MSVIHKLVTPILFLVLAACTAVVPDTPIVKTTKDAGAGDADKASVQSLSTWLRKKPEVTKSLSPQCKAAAAKGNATWSDSTEGRICQAVEIESMWLQKSAAPNAMDSNTLKSYQPK